MYVGWLSAQLKFESKVELKSQLTQRLNGPLYQHLKRQLIGQLNGQFNWRLSCQFNWRLNNKIFFIAVISSLSFIAVIPQEARAQNPNSNLDPNPVTPTLAQTYEVVPGEVIVKLKGKSSSQSARAFIGKSVSEKAMTLKGSWSGLNMHSFALKSGQSMDSALADLRADSTVEYAEPNYVVHKQSVGDPTDVVSYQQAVDLATQNQNLQSASNSGQMHAATATNTFASSGYQTDSPIQYSSAWNGQSGSRSPVIVAVIDTGIDFAHPVFTQTGVIYTNTRETAANNLDDDGNGFIDDVHGWNFVNGNNNPQDDAGHGSHVSGIILGVSQNILGNNLAAASIRIMPLKFLDSSGSGSTSDAVQAIYYAANNGAQVMNNSWGGGGFSNSLLDAIAYAYQKRVLFVAAAGNASTNNDSAPTYPANYNVPNVISVAATSDQDGLAGFSNYGVQTVHMGSPGVSIYSTLPRSSMGRESGTSMATPFITGIAALMFREQPTLSAYQVKNLIFGGGDSVNSLQSTTTNKVRLDLNSSLASAKAATAESTQPAYNASSYERSAASSGGGGGCGLVGKTAWDARNGDGDSGSSGDSNSSGPSSPTGSMAFYVMLVLLAAPIAVSVAMRNREGASRRQHTRYQIDSSVRLKFGDRELVGQVSSISLGGIQLNTEAWLENGGIVKMSIQSPDGKEEIQVDGKVVWSEEKKRYGVAFNNAGEGVLSSIQQWTAGLLKT